MPDWISNLAPHWIWLTAGVLLGAVEMLAPGFFMIWLGLAAILTGLLTALLPVSVTVQIALFAIVSLITVYAARQYIRNNPITSADSALNDRGARMTGEIVIVVEAISSSSGRVKVGDSVWSARGPEAAVGTRVRVAGTDGTVLLTEPADV